jgi:probable HAF family extracellular repeat protein
MRDLGTLGGTLGFANWLNNAGDVVGFSDLAGDQAFHPFLWKRKRMLDLGTFGGNFWQANWVNDAGTIVGWATPRGDNTAHAFVCKHGTLADLTGAGRSQCTVAGGINARGEIVGSTCDESDALLWDHDKQYDLNTLVAPSPLHLTEAEYINAKGDIVGSAVLPGGSRRVFSRIPNRSAPLPGSSMRSHPLSTITPRITRATALMLALRATHHRGVAATVIRRLHRR